MNKNLSKKDKKDWKNFLNSKDKVEDKDSVEIKFRKNLKEKTFDFHGYSLDEANKKIMFLIPDCYENNVYKLNIITGKGSRSNNNKDPYKSIDLSILKYTVPDFIKRNKELMKYIKYFSEDKVQDVNEGAFYILLKKKNTTK